MSTRLQRFDFGSLQDFRAPVVSQPAPMIVEEAPPPPPPPPMFGEEELEVARMAAKKLGYAEGFEAGIAHARKEMELKTQEVNAALVRMGTMVEGLHQGYEAVLKQQASELSTLVLAIAKKVAGDALNERGIATLMSLVERCIPVIIGRPRLLFELHPTMMDQAIERVEPLLRSHGITCEIQFRGNPAMDRFDMMLDWGNGQATQSAAATWQEIEALLERVPLEITFAETLRNNAQNI